MMLVAFSYPCALKPARNRACAFLRCSGVISLIVSPWRTLGMKNQLARSSLLKSNVALARCSGWSESRNLLAAAAISSPATCARQRVAKANAQNEMSSVGFMLQVNGNAVQGQMENSFFVAPE